MAIRKRCVNPIAVVRKARQNCHADLGFRPAPGDRELIVLPDTAPSRATRTFPISRIEEYPLPSKAAPGVWYWNKSEALFVRIPLERREAHDVDPQFYWRRTK